MKSSFFLYLIFNFNKKSKKFVFVRLIFYLCPVILCSYCFLIKFKIKMFLFVFFEKEFSLINVNGGGYNAYLTSIIKE